MQSQLSPIRTFAYIHDDLPAFHAVYVVLTLLMAALLNLGAFGMLVLAHMTLDIIKYREYHHFTWRQTIEGTFRESLVDITLLLIGVDFAVYLHHTVGIASVSGLLRAEATVIRTIGTLVPKLAILHNFLKIISHIHHYLDRVHPRLQGGLSRLDQVCLLCIGVGILLLISAPYLMHVASADILQICAEELLPWNL